MNLYCILFSLAAILKFSDSCLVIRYSEPPACACKTLKLDIWNIAENHGEPYLLYNSVLFSTIKSPEILVDDCFVQVYCEDGADFYIFDNGKGAKIGDYSLDGSCDPYQQAWQVDTGNGMEQYKELKAVCVLKSKNEAFRTGYLYMVDQEKNPPQTFDSSETGSDILDVLERFVDSNHPLICGSMVLVAMKRSPNEVDISRIVEKLRENQITVIIAAQDTFSGGLHPETMYDLAAKTNGFCAFSHHIVAASQTAPNVLAPFIVYSLNLKVSGTGTMVLPTIVLSGYGTVHLSIAVQSTGTANSFQSLKFSFRNKELGTFGSVEKTRDELKYNAVPIMNSFKVSNFLLAEPTFFEFTLDYNYSMEDTILIRLISERGIGHWFPYQD
ncbi:hypothetical protein L5515_002476 [Caenorhabditis briggsae]|uniref:DUF7154 domain-containing protein n=1 Tax=Caenorhabditis briggsae TaxID=6238 RepID=A0AAE9J5E8_CAEBR|nr:hypothetical protein L5515_002476 [Caenorhabditis briggsae]